MAVLFFLQVLNTTFFYHTHRIGNNEYISHAHPYNKTKDNAPLKSHTHSDLQIVSLENLKLIFFVSFLILAIATLTKEIGTLICKIPITRLSVIPLIRDRAPPVF
ncbi:MAG: hypothetical protein QNK33_02435 [Bacteroidales bacterium]|nr:hypothetical protein [Bacteroidales bacterium]